MRLFATKPAGQAGDAVVPTPRDKMPSAADLPAPVRGFLAAIGIKPDDMFAGVSLMIETLKSADARLAAIEARLGAIESVLVPATPDVSGELRELRGEFELMREIVRATSPEGGMIMDERSLRSDAELTMGDEPGMPTMAEQLANGIHRGPAAPGGYRSLDEALAKGG